MAEDHDLALLGWQHVNQMLDAIIRLVAHHGHFAIGIPALEDIENIEGLGGGYFRAALGPAKLVHAHIIADPQRPLEELALVVVFALAERIDDLDEDVLEQVVGQLAILGEHIDRRIDLSLMSVKKG